MDIKDFFNLVKRYKWLIVAVCGITLITTFFLVKDLPKEYKSQSKISTGLLDPSKQLTSETPTYSGPDLLIKLNQQFINIIDIMLMPKNMSILSYRLMLHDLKDPKNAFRKQSDKVKALSPVELQQAIKLLEHRFENKEVLTPIDNSSIKLYELIQSMRYDQKSLSNSLAISHENNSDFVTVEFTSENTFLSVFVVNTLSNDFINNYTIELISNKNRSILVLDSLLKKKEAVMNERNQSLKDYKIKNRVLNLDKQSQIAYQQLADFENKKAQAMFDLQALQNAISHVNTKLNSRNFDKELGAELSEDNQAIIALKNKVQKANDKYIDGGFQKKDKKMSDSLQQLLNAQLVKTNDNYTSDPLITKQALLHQRMTLGVDLDKVKGSIKDIDRELNQLNTRFSTMVPFDAGIQKHEREADVATREYLDILNHYNQANLDKNIGLKLRMEQEGAPSLPESSKKPIFLMLSLVASLGLCFFLLLLINIFDKSIYGRAKLEEQTSGKVLGELSFVKEDQRDVVNIWKNGLYPQYKNELRSTRFEIEKILEQGGHKILGISSLNSDDDKSFTVSSIAYSFSQLGRKILLIGDEEMAQEMKTLGMQNGQSFKAILAGQPIQKFSSITYVNNDLQETSLLENSNKEAVSHLFQSLKLHFDLIVVNLDSLSSLKDIKEWILFTDKYLATFKAADVISDEDDYKIKSLNADQKFVGWLMTSVKKG